jgi:hypothetical protein
VVMSRRRDQSGKIKAGCLVMLVLGIAAVYYGIDFIEIRLKAYQMQDQVTEQATFASVVDDNTIRRRLTETATRLDIPITGRQWELRRLQLPDGRRMIIRGEYTDSLVFKPFKRTMYFKFIPTDTVVIR